jgi:hypothetical protein
MFIGPKVAKKRKRGGGRRIYCTKRCTLSPVRRKIIDVDV